MDLYFDLDLIQSQKVILTPQLKQAFEILKMTSQELFEYVEEQLEANPALEATESTSIDSCDNYTAFDDLLDWEDSFNSKEFVKEQNEDENDDVNDILSEDVNGKLSLKEHLLFQLHTSDLNESQICIGEYLIDNIDENGYLTVDLAEASEFFNVNFTKVKKVLDCIQTFDPPGICARNLKECLIIQLKQINYTSRDVLKIIERHLNELAEEKFEFISQNTGLSIQQVEEIFKLVKTLEPKPGREYYNDEGIRYMIPDIIVKKTNGCMEALINEDAIPSVNINEYYKKILNADVGSEVKRFIINRIDSATWLLKCMEQRKSVLKRAAECIILNQFEFFEKGCKFLKPMDIKTIADAAGIHDSMVEEILSGKYMQCLWGILELKSFINTAV